MRLNYLAYLSSPYRYHHEYSKDVKLNMRFIIIDQVHGDLITGNEQTRNCASRRNLICKLPCRHIYYLIF